MPRVAGLCAVTGEFPAQIASNAENVSIWWRHHGGVRKELQTVGTFTWLLANVSQWIRENTHGQVNTESIDSQEKTTQTVLVGLSGFNVFR